MSEKVLELNNVTISFKTDNGFVRAVRGVSFDLYKGETLCVVGESGSGKSVTSRAIMGILANNAVVEKGEIIYNGENLLEISEEEFHRLRGKKIGMIFQDPLSSLNPIVKIGKQITEATLVNGNKLKLMFEDLTSAALSSYKNEINIMNIEIKRETTRVEMLNNDLLAGEEVSQENKDKAKANLVELKTNLNAIKAKHKPLISSKKANLKEVEKDAKKKVSEYKVEQKKIYNEEVTALKAKLVGADEKTKASINDKISVAKENYINKLKVTKKVAKEKALEIMKEVGIPQPEKRFKQYPFEFSGGMRQRIVIAIALTANPELLICDEPTTALDVTIQAQILDLINKLKVERNLSCIFITHDLGVVANMADRVAVMYAGQIVEYGKVNELFYSPKHPYTWALLSSVPDVESSERLEAIPGTPPNMIYPPKGDAFALRSKYAMNIDFKEQPPFFKISDTHYAATWLLHEKAPKVEMPKIVSTRIESALKGVNLDEIK